MKNIDDLLYTTDFSLSDEFQNELCQWILDNGHEAGGVYGKTKPFWQAQIFRDCHYSTLPSPVFNFLKQNSHLYAEVCHFLRLEPNICWRWSNRSIAKKLEEEISSLMFFFKRLTRVAAFLQKPGMSINAHCDLVPGCRYKGIVDEFTAEIKSDNDLIYQGAKWWKDIFTHQYPLVHKKQGYLGLRIPISLNPNLLGRQYLKLDSKKYYYDTANRAFFINEYQIMHGADAVDFVRGVLFVDGELNLDKVELIKNKNI